MLYGILKLAVQHTNQGLLIQQSGYRIELIRTVEFKHTTDGPDRRIPAVGMRARTEPLEPGASSLQRCL